MKQTFLNEFFNEQEYGSQIPSTRKCPESKFILKEMAKWSNSQFALNEYCESWISDHVNAYKYFGGVMRITMEKMHYIIPYKYIKHKADVKITRRLCV